VPNVIIQQVLAARYADAVAGAVADLVGRALTVGFEVTPRLFRQMKARQEGELADLEPISAGPVSFRPVRALAPASAEWRFDNLIVSRTNRLPFEAARELAGQENPRFRFLYICGGYGAGKTALLRAIYALASGPERGLDPVYMTAEQWCNEYYHAIQRKTTHLFRGRYRPCNMLLLDDVQFVQGKAAGQRELLHTIKHILGRGGRVALSGAPHPEEMHDVDPALLAMLRSAFPAVLLPPGQDERLGVARELAARHGLDAVEEVLGLVAQRHGDTFAALEAALCHLALYARVHGCGKVELAVAREAFAAMGPADSRPVDIEAVKKAVGEAFGVSPAQMTGRSRSRTTCAARHAAIYLARQLTAASLAEVGRAFGGISHSTVKHAADKTAAARRSDPTLGTLLERLARQLGGA
jgi:chromosomal replication initiator protein